MIYPTAPSELHLPQDGSWKLWLCAICAVAFVTMKSVASNHGDHPSSRHRLVSSVFFNASHAARCVACHGARSHPVPVALVGECSTPIEVSSRL